MKAKVTIFWPPELLFWPRCHYSGHQWPE